VSRLGNAPCEEPGRPAGDAISRTRRWPRWASVPSAPTFLLLGIALLGFVARAWLVNESLGTNDIVTWRTFATEIDVRGLGFVYDNNSNFNHPPLMGLLAQLLYVIAAKTGMRFDVLFKTPQLMADAAAAALIYWAWRRRSPLYAGAAAALFCWNPASLLVSAYHGNTDPLCAALALAAVVLADAKRPLLAGLVLGAGINVKLIPTLLIPVLYSSVGDWKKTARFTAGLSVGVLPFVPIALWHWKGFFAHCLNYASFPGVWGITGVLRILKENPNLREILNHLHLRTFWEAKGALIVLLAPFALAGVNLMRGRRWSARELGAGAFSLFLVLTPGFGVQYIVYPVALLFVANLGRAVAFSTMAGLYALALYYGLWTRTQPFYSSFYVPHPPSAMLLGYFAWLVLIRSVIDLLRARKQPPLLTRSPAETSSIVGEGAAAARA
jgi:hypothetical protein